MKHSKIDDERLGELIKELKDVTESTGGLLPVYGDLANDLYSAICELWNYRRHYRNLQKWGSLTCDPTELKE